MPKVFVPNKNQHDYTEAWDFGELVFCTSGDLSRTDVLTMQADIESAMADAEPSDFILISSLAVLCGIACGVFAARFGELHLLIFENGHYVERHLSLDETTETTES